MASALNERDTRPGFWRRIRLHPQPGMIVAGLEDDVHRFLLRIAHKDGIITGVDARAERYPWSTCTGASAFLNEQMVGQSLQEIAALDPLVHCTHLFELAILCAAHAQDSEPTQFDFRVADRIEERTTATLTVNGRLIIRWDVDGTLIEAPGDWAGRDLRALSKWKRDLPQPMAERAVLLRRAMHVSGARRQPELMANRAADRPGRIGVCFTYQMPRAQDAVQSSNWRIDFSKTGEGPLQNFDPEKLARIDWTDL